MTREELLKIAKPMLFNTDMVRAILEDRKTATRRLVKSGKKSTPRYHNRDKFYGIVDHLNNDYKNWYAGFYNDADIFYIDGEKHIDACYWKAPYQPGDILYVRETWRVGAWDVINHTIAFDYKDGACGKLTYIHNRELFDRLVNQSREDARKVGCVYSGADFVWDKGKSPCRWHPSIHMPKEAARIFLKVKDVRVERLQGIASEQICREGVEVEYPNVLNGEEKRYAFSQLWNSTIKKSDLELYGWNANPWVWVIEFERITVE